MAAQKEGGKKSSGPAMDARKEMSKTKEQVEEEMKISLRIRIKPLDLDAMDSDELKAKAAAEEQGDQEGSRPRVLHPEAPSHHQDVLQVREEDGHKELRRPQEVVRGRRRGDPRRVA